MSQKLIDHSPDLKRLKDEGYEILIKQNVLLVYHIPYVNSQKEIKYGVLATELSLQSNELTTVPAGHLIYFQGDHPCNKDGTEIQAIKSGTTDRIMVADFHVQHSFSNKPPGGYSDYYEKINSYASIISAPAISMDENVTAKSFRVISDGTNDSPFIYIDTHSSRAEINVISDKLKGLKIAIIGLGGTGSYILDLLSKTSVAEIHLFDGDIFCQHNAFRSPGSASCAELDEGIKKVIYYERMYSKMHSGIIAHPYNITAESFHELKGFSHVFLSIDKGKIKSGLFNYLIINKIPLIDSGMGVQNVENSLLGAVRITSGTPEKNDHLVTRVSMADEEVDDLYKTNIQIAELNALNAALAIIKWKKMCGFYIDQEHEHHSVYSISESIIFNADTTAPFC